MHLWNANFKLGFTFYILLRDRMGIKNLLGRCRRMNGVQESEAQTKMRRGRMVFYTITLPNISIFTMMNDAIYNPCILLIYKINDI